MKKYKKNPKKPPNCQDNPARSQILPLETLWPNISICFAEKSPNNCGQNINELFVDSGLDISRLKNAWGNASTNNDTIRIQKQKRK